MMLVRDVSFTITEQNTVETTYNLTFYVQNKFLYNTQ